MSASSYENEPDADTKRVERIVADLGEHFDAVQVFVTRNESEAAGTRNISVGYGNWFARYGHVRSWIVRVEESERESVRNKD